MSALGYLRRTAAERLPPPIAHTGILGWLRANLLSSPANVVLTVICTSLIIWVVPPLLRFLLIDAVWSGSDRTACLATAANPDPGACWAFVRVWFSYFVYGFYPIAQRWRVDVFFAALVVRHRLAGLAEAPRRGLGAIYFFVGLPLVSLVLLYGFPAIGLAACRPTYGAGCL